MAWKYRYTVLAVLGGGYFLSYVDRMVMASTIPFIAQDFHLSPTLVGAILSAFFLGYALMQIPGGLLADRYGPRVVLTASIMWWSLMTALTGVAPGLTAMLVIRTVFGLGEGPFPAAASKCLSIWFPTQEIGRANGLLLGATYVGATVAPLLVTAMIVPLGWRAVFYVLLIPGVVLGLLLWRYAANGPAVAQHPSRENPLEDSPAEAALLHVKANFLRSLRAPGVLWCAASFFLANTVAWGLTNWLPTYLLQAWKFPVAKMGVFAAVTNLAGAVGFMLGGYLCDRYFTDRLRVPIIVGLLTSAVFTYLAAVAPSGEWAVAALVLVFLFSNIAFTALLTLPLVLVPKETVGAAYGVVNTAGQLSGVLAPLLVGYLLDLTGNSFRVVLYTMMVLAAVAMYPAGRIRQTMDPATRYESAT